MERLILTCFCGIVIMLGAIVNSLISIDKETQKQTEIQMQSLALHKIAIEQRISDDKKISISKE